MDATVTMLLRDFPKIRRAALAGETVIIHSKEGNFRFTLDAPKKANILGCLAGHLIHCDDDIDTPTWGEDEWKEWEEKWDKKGL